MAKPTIYGTPFSTYVRTARMCLEEKGQDYDLVDVNVLAGETRQHPHLGRNPFGTVPAFEHDGFAVYETSPIIRYIDQVFPGVALTPADPRERARMNQTISIADYHGYSSIIGKICMQRLFGPMVGGTTDEAVIGEGLPKAKLCLSEFERLMGSHKFLAGSQVSLADFYVVPILFYMLMTPEKSLMGPHPALRRWWDTMQSLPAVSKTAPKLP
jgi:glutathione S-transferase